MNRVARQTVRASQRGDASILHSAQPAFGRCPERTVPVETKMPDEALAQTVGRRIARAKLTVYDIGDATLIKPKPETAGHGVRGQAQRKILASEPGPRDLLNVIDLRNAKQTSFLARDPHIAG